MVAVDFAVQLRDVWLRLGHVWILRGVTLDICRGQHVMLLGENGAGKTTLLHVLASAVRATRGEGRVFGFDLRDSRAVRECIHLVPAYTGLYLDLSSTENLAFAMRMHGKSGDITAALRLAGLSAVTHKPVRFFSAGMRRRLALARALLLAQPLVLLDEPLAHLDQEGKQFALEICSALADQGSTLIVATHETMPMSSLQPTMLALHGGRLENR